MKRFPARTPRVLFVDEDHEALDLILLRIEPVFNAVSLRTAGPLARYLDEFRPDVVVISDRVRWRRENARDLVARISEQSEARKLVLAECLSPDDESTWRECGASGTLLHPTRVRTRLELMTQAVANLALRGVMGA